MRHHTGLSMAFAAALALAGADGLQAQERATAQAVDDAALEWGGCPGFMPEGCRIAVLHGAPSEPDADIFYRVPGGAEIPRHWHSSPERMVLVEGQLRVSYDGQDPVTLEPGVYGYGPAQKPHAATCLSDGPCTLFIAFTKPIDAFEGAPGETEGG